MRTPAVRLRQSPTPDVCMRTPVSSVGMEGSKAEPVWHQYLSGPAATVCLLPAGSRVERRGRKSDKRPAAVELWSGADQGKHLVGEAGPHSAWCQRHDHQHCWPNARLHPGRPAVAAGLTDETVARTCFMAMNIRLGLLAKVVTPKLSYHDLRHFRCGSQLPRRFRQHEIVVVEGIQKSRVSDKLVNVERPQPAQGPVKQSRAPKRTLAANPVTASHTQQVASAPPRKSR